MPHSVTGSANRVSGDEILLSARGEILDRVAVDLPSSSANGGPAEGLKKAMIYTRMGVIFHASTWTESMYGIKAKGVWSTGPSFLEVFLPWTSVDSIRLT